MTYATIWMIWIEVISGAIGRQYFRKLSLPAEEPRAHTRRTERKPGRCGLGPGL